MHEPIDRFGPDWMRLPIGVVNRPVEHRCRFEIIAFCRGQNRLSAGLTNTGHSDFAHVGFRYRAQKRDDGIEIEQNFVVAELTTIIAARQRFAIAGKARKEVRHDRDVAGIDEFLSEISGMLHDAVTLMQMNHHGFFAGAGRDAKVSIDSISDFNGCEHDQLPFQSLVNEDPEEERVLRQFAQDVLQHCLRRLQRRIWFLPSADAAANFTFVEDDQS